MPAAFNLQGITIARNQKLSDLDRAYMVINYPRDVPSTDPVASQWTVDRALTFVGVPAATKQTILNFWRARQYDKMRLAFNTWNAIMQSVNMQPAEGDAKSPLEDMQDALNVYSDVLSQVAAGTKD